MTSAILGFKVEPVALASLITPPIDINDDFTGNSKISFSYICYSMYMKSVIIYIQTAQISVNIYNDCKKSVCIYLS